VADIFETSEAEIRKLLLRWTRTPIAWDGLNNAGTFTPPTGAPWIRPSITDVSADQRSFGPAGLVHQVGILFVQVFVPLGSGKNELLQYLKELGGIFKGKVGRLTFQQSERRIIGPDESWYQGNLEVVFDYLVHMPAGQVEGFEQMVFTQSDHGFAAGNAVYLNGTTWTKADASSTSSRAIGVVSAASGDDFTVVSHGFVTLASHGLGTSGVLWLSTAAGTIGTTAPDDVVQEMGVIVDANTILLDIKAHST
jgi:hypothetical protein